jgi:hypothetical protein
MALAKKLALHYIQTQLRVLSLLSGRKAAEKAFELFCTPQYRNKKTLPKIFEKAESLQFQFQDYKVQGYRWNGAAEKKVLILHGFESSIVNFDHFVDPLVAKGYCVLGFDAPAHGRSSGKLINVLIYKAFVDELQRRYGPIKNFIAHSFGGLAISLALESWTGQEDYKAVLIAPATETSTAVDYLFKVLKLPSGLRVNFEEVILEKGAKPVSWFSIGRAAENIKSQILWLHDKDDDITPLKDVEPVMQKGYSNFRFHITEGLGHRRIYRDKALTAEIIAFL